MYKLSFYYSSCQCVAVSLPWLLLRRAQALGPVGFGVPASRLWSTAVTVVVHGLSCSEACGIFQDPMDCSLPGSFIHGILQARVLEWGAIALSEQMIQMTLFTKWK